MTAYNIFWQLLTSFDNFWQLSTVYHSLSQLKTNDSSWQPSSLSSSQELRSACFSETRPLLGHFLKKSVFCPLEMSNTCKNFQNPKIDQKMAKYETPPLFFTWNFFYQNDSEWPKMDFKHNFKKCNILSAGPPPPPDVTFVTIFFFFLMKASLTHQDKNWWWSDSDIIRT